MEMIPLQVDVMGIIMEGRRVDLGRIREIVLNEAVIPKMLKEPITAAGRWRN
jgi:hypothetical protein